MTKHEAAVVMAYTGIAMLTGDNLKYFYQYCEKLLGYPIWTHEFPYLAETIAEKAKPEFIEICKNLTESDEPEEYERDEPEEYERDGTPTIEL